MFQKKTILAAQSSFRSLVVCRLVCRSVHLYKKSLFTCLLTYLPTLEKVVTVVTLVTEVRVVRVVTLATVDISDSREINDSKDSSDSRDINDSSNTSNSSDNDESSVSSDQNTFFFTTKHFSQKNHFVTKDKLFNRPGVGGAVLQSASSFIH